MDDSHPAGDVAPSALVEASGPTESPWLRILFRCLTYCLPAVVLVGLIALFAVGVTGLLSALFGGGIVIVFFAISLLIGHFVGRRNPSGALGVFAISYVVKFVGFAALFLVMGAPQWLERISFMAAAIVVVLLWQSVEIMVFSKLRLQLFADQQPTDPGVANG